MYHLVSQATRVDFRHLYDLFTYQAPILPQIVNFKATSKQEREVKKSATNIITIYPTFGLINTLSKNLNIKNIPEIRSKGVDPYIFNNYFPRLIFSYLFKCNTCLLIFVHCYACASQESQSWYRVQAKISN